MTARPTYNHCGICGRVPHTSLDEPNYGPIRYWEPDDGWRIGTLCRWCQNEFGSAKPKPDDFAYQHHDDVCTGEPDTDEDPTEAIGT